MTLPSTITGSHSVLMVSSNARIAGSSGGSSPASDCRCSAPDRHTSAAAEDPLNGSRTPVRSVPSQAVVTRMSVLSSTIATVDAPARERAAATATGRGSWPICTQRAREARAASLAADSRSASSAALWSVTSWTCSNVQSSPAGPGIAVAVLHAQRTSPSGFR